VSDTKIHKTRLTKSEIKALIFAAGYAFASMTDPDKKPAMASGAEKLRELLAMAS
jgi:hypothetical protein